MQVRRRVCSFVCASSTSRVKCARERERVVCGGCVDPRGLVAREPRELREPRSPCASPSVRTAAAAFFSRSWDEKTNPPLSLHTHYNRSSSLRRGTSAFPTCPLSPTTRSPGRSTTSSATDGLHASSSPARRRPTPTSSSSPALLSTRTGTGPCGSSPCSDASPEMRFSPRSRTARTSTQDTGSGLSDSTTSGSARWPASSAGSKQDLSFGSRSRLAPLN